VAKTSGDFVNRQSSVLRLQNHLVLFHAHHLSDRPLVSIPARPRVGNSVYQVTGEFCLPFPTSAGRICDRAHESRVQHVSI
jgi:hypothetical protein